VEFKKKMVGGDSSDDEVSSDSSSDDDDTDDDDDEEIPIPAMARVGEPSATDWAGQAEQELALAKQQIVELKAQIGTLE
jgi:hypothetical protein